MFEYSDDIWMLLAGIGIFLFGIYLLEEAIKNLSGKSFKRLLKNYTDNKFKAILTGTFSTAVLQSSSAVTLIVIAFVGAGIMKLSNAVSVIVGSNLGTTVTSWIVASLGFKFSIEGLALPVIAIGGLGLIFLGKEGKYSNVSKLLVGFGFIFMGLDYMKNGVSDIVENIPLEILKGRNFFIYVLAGFILTGIVQSSSASMALILSSVYSGMIDFGDACAMVIGSNVGTTITVIIGTLGATVAMKRVAFSHFFFNVITGLVAIVTFPLVKILIEDILNLAQDPVTGLAMFHTVFNLMGVIVFLPFTMQFSEFIKRIYPEKKSFNTRYIHAALPEVPEASITPLLHEVKYLQQLTMCHNLMCLYIDHTLVLKTLKDSDGNNIPFPTSPEEAYKHIKNIQSEIFEYTSKVQLTPLSPLESELLGRLLHAVRYAAASAKTMKDYKHEFEALYNSDHDAMMEYYQYFRQKMMNLFLGLNAIETMEEKNSILSALHNIAEKHRNEDATFNQQILTKMSSDRLKSETVNTILSTQKGYSQSGRQMIVSFKDYYLEKEESKVYDALESRND